MRTPAMGYNPWNAFHDKINETVVLRTADLMVELGLVGAGYEYLVLDGTLRPAPSEAREKAPALFALRQPLTQDMLHRRLAGEAAWCGRKIDGRFDQVPVRHQEPGRQAA